MTTMNFQTVKIEENIEILRNYFSPLSKDPSVKPTDREKFTTWIERFDIIMEKISAFDKNALPKIESDLGYRLSNRNLVLTAITQPSVKNTFREIKDHFRNTPEIPISQTDLMLLEECSDTAGSLAWAGDNAIKLAILLDAWRPGIKPVELHNRRQDLETNKNLSKLCDQWQLFEHRIRLDEGKPDQKTTEKIEGTLVEAIYGVIFIEKKMRGVQAALHLINPSKNFC